jgi:hypothetical protein
LPLFVGIIGFGQEPVSAWLAIQFNA